MQTKSKVGTYIEAMARRPVGACKIMITHIRCIEKMQLIEITGLVSVVILNTHQYSPEVEGTVPYQITNQTRLSP
jgi:hypothetical protein